LCRRRSEQPSPVAAGPQHREAEPVVERDRTGVLAAHAEVHTGHLLGGQSLPQFPHERAAVAPSLRLGQQVDVQVGGVFVQRDPAQHPLRVRAPVEQPTLRLGRRGGAVTLDEDRGPRPLPPTDEGSGVGHRDEVPHRPGALIDHPREATRIAQVRLEVDVRQKPVVRPSARRILSVIACAYADDAQRREVVEVGGPDAGGHSRSTV